MRIAKPWLRKATGTWWFVVINGKQFNLGKDKKAAHARFHELMHHGVTAQGNSTMRQVLDAYWNWLKKIRADSTSENRKPILKSFGDSVPKR
jgi:hypothetical protein